MAILGYFFTTFDTLLVVYLFCWLFWGSFLNAFRNISGRVWTLGVRMEIYPRSSHVVSVCPSSVHFLRFLCHSPSFVQALPARPPATHTHTHTHTPARPPARERVDIRCPRENSSQITSLRPTPSQLSSCHTKSFIFFLPRSICSDPQRNTHLIVPAGRFPK